MKNKILDKKNRLILFPLISSYYEIRKKYKRSLLGPFWITLSLLFFIVILSFVVGIFLGSGSKSNLAYISVGIVAWHYISVSINESTTLFIESESLMKQINLPLYVYFLKIVFKNTIIFFHNALLIPFLFLYLKISVNITSLFSFVGLLLIAVNLLWICAVASIISVRFRDFPPIIGSLLQAFFYLTPIMWTFTQLDKIKSILVQVNPFYHMIEVVRAPLIDGIFPFLSAAILVILALFGNIFAYFIVNKYKFKIIYWL